MVSKQSLVPDNKVSTLNKNLDQDQTTEDKTQELSQFKFINNKKASQENQLSPILKETPIIIPIRPQSVSKLNKQLVGKHKSNDHSRVRGKGDLKN